MCTGARGYQYYLQPAQLCTLCCVAAMKTKEAIRWCLASIDTGHGTNDGGQTDGGQTEVIFAYNTWDASHYIISFRNSLSCATLKHCYIVILGSFSSED